MYLGYFFNALGRVFSAWVSDMLGRARVYFLLYAADRSKVHGRHLRLDSARMGSGRNSLTPHDRQTASGDWTIFQLDLRDRDRHVCSLVLPLLARRPKGGPAPMMTPSRTT
jgi:hypothetical protein